MRKPFFITGLMALTLLSAGALSAEEPEILTLGRIRVDIDGIRFTDNGSGFETVTSEALPSMKPETVMTFTTLRPGSRWKDRELADELKRSAKRLADSGYFYDTRVIGVPSAADPAIWNINITVSGGFHLRFGGGDTFALFGLAALGGRREELRFRAGYNRAGISWQGIAPGHWYWNVSALYTNEGSYDHSPEWHRGDLLTEGGWQPLPDFRAGLYIQPVYYRRIDGDRTRTDILAGPKFHLSADFFPDPLLLETELAGSGTVIHSLSEEPEHPVKGEFSGLFRLEWKGLSLCGLAAGGMASDNIPELYLTDLYDTEDRQVRSGWRQSELTASDWLLFSGEFRVTVFKKYIPPFFNLGTELFVFTDHALIPDWRDAWGGGLRIKLDNPVFVYFTFAMGWNREGEGRFTLTTTAGF